MSATAIVTMFSSFSQLRQEHRRLQKAHRDAPHSEAVLEEIEAFIRRGAAAGAVLDSESDQAAAQSLLDFWATVIYREKDRAPESTLAAFDPTQAPVLDDAVVPYIGLDSFVEHKRDVFFGRERAVDALVSRLECENFLAVIGPSGSGKSSLVLAGLLPALRSGRLPGSADWKYLGRMVPGADPLGSLVRLLDGRAHDSEWIAARAEQLRSDPNQLPVLLEQLSSTQPTVLVIDQFEELSTLTEDGASRDAFEQALVALVRPGRLRRIVVLTMRSDFIGAVARQPELQHLLETALEPVTPLTAAELREAIEKPAEHIGLKFEEGVVDALVHDILGEPAALPLLQFTLLKLWESRDRNRVTLHTYQQLGGGRLALTQTADRFIQTLIPQDRVMAERIFLQLVRPGTGQDYVAKRVRRRSLYNIGPTEHVDRVLNKLIGERLIRLTGDSDSEQEVEIAHEALGRNWQHFVTLLERDREQLNVRRRLELNAAEWVRLGRGEGGLLKSIALYEAEAWIAKPGAEALVSDDVRALVGASRAAANASKRRQRLARAALLALTVTSLLLAGAAGYGMFRAQRLSAEAYRASQEVRVSSARIVELTEKERQRADEQRLETQRKAEEDRREAQESAQRDARLAEARRRLLEEQNRRLKEEGRQERAKASRYDADLLAKSAEEALSDDPERATLLALQGALLLERHGQPLALNVQSALYRSIVANRVRAVLPVPPRTTLLAFSADNRRLATSGEEEPFRIWDTHTAALLQVLPAISSTAAAAFSPDGRALAVAGRSVDLLDATTGKLLRTIMDPAPLLQQLAFSPDGRVLAGIGFDHVVHRWKLENGNDTDHKELREHKDIVRALAFSPTGAFLATGSADRSVRVWDADSGNHLTSLQDQAGAINDLTFHPDGQRLMFASANRVRQWRPFAVSPTAAETTIEDLALAGEVQALSVTPNGRRLLALHASRGDDIRNEGVISDDLRPHPSFGGVTVTTIDLPGSQGTPANMTGLTRGTTAQQRWSVIDRFSLPAPNARSFRFSPDATLLSTGADSSGARVWNVEPGSGVIVGLSEEPIARLMSSRIDTFVTSGASGTVRVWDLSRAGHELTRVIQNAGGPIVALSPDGTRAALPCLPSCGIRIFDIGRDTVERTLESKEPVNALAFDPTGSMLASASGGTRGTVRLWDLTTGHVLATSGPTTGIVSALVVSGQNGPVAAVTDGQAVLFPRNGTELLKPFSLPADTAKIQGIAFSPDGTMVATASTDRTIRLWKLGLVPGTLPRLVRELVGHTAGVRSVAFSSDSALLVSAGDDKTARIWSLASADFGANLVTIGVGAKAPSSAAFTPDVSAVLVTGDDGTLRRFPVPGKALLFFAVSGLTRTFQADECRNTTMCTGLPAAVDLIVKGNWLARQGDTGRAIAKYRAALELDRQLPLSDSNQAKSLGSQAIAEAQRHEVRGIRTQIERLATAGRTDEALTLLARLSSTDSIGLDVQQLASRGRTADAAAFRGLAQIAANRRNQELTVGLLKQAASADPGLRIDVDAEAINMLNDGVIRQATSLVSTRNVAAAVELLKQLRDKGVTRTPFDTDAEKANQLCWWGSLENLELARSVEVRRACSNTVELSNGLDNNFRDSRGLNLARNGQLSAAIEDFKAFVADPLFSESHKEPRRRWIERLSKGIDPFTPEELAKLR